MTLEPALPVAVHLGPLAAEDRYRATFALTPFLDADFDPLTEFEVPRGTTGTFQYKLFVPVGWSVRGMLTRRTRNNAPCLDFARSQPRHSAFLSLLPHWSDWGPVASGGPVVVYGQRSYLGLLVSAPISIGGYVANRPLGETGELYVSVQSTLGNWDARVDSVGFFEFTDVPLGSYQILLFRYPSEPELDPPQATLVTGLREDFKYSRFDLLIPWPEPEQGSSE